MDGEDLANNRLNRELFELELMNASELGKFMNWEISHIQTITDLAA